MRTTLTAALAMIIYYLAVVWSTGFFTDPHHFLFQYAPDSLDYTSVADWIFYGTPSDMVARRGFFYPLVMGLARATAGDWGVWGLHASLWLATMWLLWLSLDQLAVPRVLRVGIVIIFALNWSSILLTLVVVTESLARFAFALLTYLALRSRWAESWLVGGLLAVIKPNYAPLWILLSLIFLAIKLLGRWQIPWSRWGLYFALAATPLTIQVTLAQATRASGSQNTDIASFVLQQYFYPQVLARVTNQDRVTVKAQIDANPPPTSAVLPFLIEHPGAVLACFAHNLEENLRGVFYVDTLHHDAQNFWRKHLNGALYWLHVLMVIPLLISLWQTRFLRTPSQITLWILALLWVGGILPTGITYWGADRLSTPLLPVWPVLYTIIWHRKRSTWFFGRQFHPPRRVTRQ